MLAPDVNTIGEMLERRIGLSGPNVCYSTKTGGTWTPVTWDVFNRQIEQMAAGLMALGIENGDAVATLGDTCPHWCQADMGTIVIGGISVGIYSTLMTDQIQFIVEDSGAKVLFVQGADNAKRVLPLLDAVASLQHIVVWDCEALADERVLHIDDVVATGRDALTEDPDHLKWRRGVVAREQVALIVYTSGTTGRPKGVPLSHGNVLSGLAAGEGLIGDITPEDVTLSFLPMAHVGEHVPGFLGRINIGLQTAFATSYDTVIDELQEIRPTFFGGVPRIFEKMYGRILERVAGANPRRQAIFAWARDLARRNARALTAGQPLNFKDRMLLPVADKLIYKRIRDVFGGRVKAFVTGAAPLQMDILEFFTGAGMKIIEVYGLSEAGAISFANTLDEQHLGTVGRPIPGLDFKLADDGEILLKGPTVFGGYLNLESENEALFTPDGYLRTGDIGQVDDNGCLRITDRKKNLIKTAGGKFVSPTRVESLVKTEPLVSQVYVHGDHRPYVVALITLDDREIDRVAEELNTTAGALWEHPEVHQRMSRAVERANEKLATFEQLKRFAILPRDFSIEDDTLTATLKQRRRNIAERYGEQLEALYQEASADWKRTQSSGVEELANTRC